MRSQSSISHGPCGQLCSQITEILELAFHNGFRTVVLLVPRRIRLLQPLHIERKVTHHCHQGAFSTLTTLWFCSFIAQTQVKYCAAANKEVRKDFLDQRILSRGYPPRPHQADSSQVIISSTISRSFSRFVFFLHCYIHSRSSSFNPYIFCSLPPKYTTSLSAWGIYSAVP